MLNFDWLYKKNNDKSKWAIIWIVIFFFFFVLKKIIESWYVLHTIIFFVLLVWVWMFYDWAEKINRGKPASLWSEFSKKYPIITQYEPPKWINPAEAWLLYNLKVDTTDLTSLVYQWKYEWLIDVKTVIWKNSGKEYIKLIKKNEIPLARPLFETEIFDSIFSMWNVKIIEWAFQLRYALMLEDLEFRWIKKWWVVKWGSSRWLKLLYEFLVALLFVSILLYFTEFLVIFPEFWLFILWLLFICVMLWWYVGGWAHLRFTDKWAKLASHLIWYSNFIKSCDENKIKLILKDDPLFVDRTLPYATAFWLETQFLSKISPLRTERSAKYASWKKVLPWMWIIRLLFRSDDNPF